MTCGATFFRDARNLKSFGCLGSWLRAAPESKRESKLTEEIMADDALLIAAAALLASALGIDARREATDQEVRAAVSNAEKLRDELAKRRSEQVKMK